MCFHNAPKMLTRATMSAEYEKWLDRHLDDLRRKGKMEGTIANNRKYCSAFIRFVEGQPKRQRTSPGMNEATVRAFASYLLEQRYTPKTVASMIGGVLQWGRWLALNDGAAIFQCSDATAASVVDDALTARRG